MEMLGSSTVCSPKCLLQPECRILQPTTKHFFQLTRPYSVCLLKWGWFREELAGYCPGGAWNISCTATLSENS